MDNLKKVVIGIWVLWYNRNKAVHENYLSTVNQCYNKVVNLNVQFGRRAVVGWGGDLRQEVQCTFTNIIFCEGPWLATTNTGGFGAVAWEGKSVEGCTAGSWSNCCNSLEAEIHGIVEGLKFHFSRKYTDSVGQC